jgi:hypothetical protein
MAHVGVKRFRAGHPQKNAAEDDEADRPTGIDEGRARDRAQSLQNAPIRGDMQNSEHGVNGEKHDHDRAEEGGDFGRSAALGGEQHNENDNGRR